ncbi:MAG: ATP-binding protein [Catonella sp.]|uniref:ATP-binding protein n=1 Tax=Catonella sp. TaxID=2382125 RepID=UPI003F9FF4DF
MYVDMELFNILKEECLELVFVFDLAGDFMDCSNKAKESLGCLQGELTGSFSDIFPNLVLEETSAFENVETDIYRKNKTCFPADVKIMKFGEQGYVVFAIDQTENKNMARELAACKEELKSELKYKTEFVSNITHELRTPVNGIQGMAKNLFNTELNSYQLETVGIIENCCVNMSKIINDLLDFSKMESDKLVLENKAFSFREFLNNVMAFNVTLVNEKGLKLLVHVGDDIPKYLIGDELRLTQIFNNLLSNAIKFTTIGHIAVEASLIREEDDFVELFFMVVDTGIGIAKENMDKLFKKFSQVDASTTRRFGGTGLGLSITKKLVELMGGGIKVESEAGKGSSFSFNVILKKSESAGETTGVELPNGNFIYEGSGQYTESEEESRYAGDGAKGWKLTANSDSVYQFGTSENIREINSALEKLFICIELENWEKAENFAGVIKNLISDDESEQRLKKEAFRLELIIRRGDHDKAIAQFNLLKSKLAEIGF